MKDPKLLPYAKKTNYTVVQNLIVLTRLYKKPNGFYISVIQLQKVVTLKLFVFMMGLFFYYKIITFTSYCMTISMQESAKYIIFNS